MSHVIERWHAVVASRNPSGLDALLADEVVFHSPVVHTPQRGKAVTKGYLSAAVMVFCNETFHYVRQVIGEHDAVLEFETTISGTHVNGVDMIRWNDAGQIVDFKVMVRPLRAIQLIHQLMAQQLGPR